MEQQSALPLECQFASALSDHELLTVVEGQASRETLDHLRQCPACAARARAVAGLHAYLQRRLFRLFCPTTDELAAHYQRTLRGTANRGIAHHLAECPHCAREFRILTAMMHAPPVAGSTQDGHASGAGPAEYIFGWSRPFCEMPRWRCRL